MYPFTIVRVLFVRRSCVVNNLSVQVNATWAAAHVVAGGRRLQVWSKRNGVEEAQKQPSIQHSSQLEQNGNVHVWVCSPALSLTPQVLVYR